jgi:hypothetical protein
LTKPTDKKYSPDWPAGCLYLIVDELNDLVDNWIENALNLFCLDIKSSSPNTKPLVVVDTRDWNGVA